MEFFSQLDLSGWIIVQFTIKAQLNSLMCWTQWLMVFEFWLLKFYCVLFVFDMRLRAL